MAEQRAAPRTAGATDEGGRTAWLLPADERGNPDSRLDAGTPGWTEGNDVTPLVHGATYFRDLLHRVRAMRRGDLILFTDWRGDPDQLMDGPGTTVGGVLADAARRGVDVRGLVWRSHLDRLQFSAAENRHLGEEIEAAGGQCLLDMRVRPFGSHHQKLVVLRHPGRPELDVAYIGGIDLCHSRRDDEHHDGDAQRQAMARIYGDRPPWHDVQLAVRGPAVGQAETVFRERWDDPAPLSRNPVHLLGALMFREQWRPRPLPPRLPDPAACGSTAVQLLRTYPARLPGYGFARRGERSVARGYQRALSRAQHLVYVEDQYLWSVQVARVFAQALHERPDLRVVFVVPRAPDQDGRITLPLNLVGRAEALRVLRAAGGERVAVYFPENDQGTPIYVHAKVCVVDDLWACVGSDNANLRSWTHDSELSAAFVDGSTEGVARDLRRALAREHLGVDAGAEAVAAIDDPADCFVALRESAAALDGWHAGGRRGPRPPGRLRTYQQPALSPITVAWARPLHRLAIDPDGRGPVARLRRAF